MATAKKTSAAAKARADAAAREVAEGKGELYDVVSNLDHDGKRYAPDSHDDQVVLDAVTAERLLGLGVIKPAAG